MYIFIGANILNIKNICKNILKLLFIIIIKLLNYCLQCLWYVTEAWFWQAELSCSIMVSFVFFLILLDSCQLTLDPNTAYKELMLSDGNQKVTRKKTTLFYADHPERFDGFSQVLCREALSGSRYYWEVQWSGEFSIGVAYKSINRKGKNSSSLLGYNDKSWSMLCSDTGYSVWHNKLDKDLPCASHAPRVGVYLDHRGGSLAFYAVSQSMELIYKFVAKFTEPLYAGFGVGSTVSICHLRDSFSNLHWPK